MNLFTYVVEDRLYNKQDVLALINREHGAHTILAGNKHKGLITYVENSFKVLSVFAHVYAVISTLAEFSKEKDKQDYKKISSNIDFLTNSAADKALHMLTSYQESDIPDNFYQGREVVTLLNKMNEADWSWFRSEIIKNQAVNNFLNHKYADLPVPDESDIGYIFGPAAVLEHDHSSYIINDLENSYI